MFRTVKRGWWRLSTLRRLGRADLSQSRKLPKTSIANRKPCAPCLNSKFVEVNCFQTKRTLSMKSRQRSSFRTTIMLQNLSKKKRKYSWSSWMTPSRSSTFTKTKRQTKWMKNYNWKKAITSQNPASERFQAPTWSQHSHKARLKAIKWIKVAANHGRIPSSPKTNYNLIVKKMTM